MAILSSIDWVLTTLVVFMWVLLGMSIADIISDRRWYKRIVERLERYTNSGDDVSG
jgi:hypothetical protein